jgi:hypothetical protein
MKWLIGSGLIILHEWPCLLLTSYLTFCYAT